MIALSAPDDRGRREVECPVCLLRLETAAPLDKIYHRCQGQPPLLPPELLSAAEAEAPRRGMLAGDLIAALTKALGVPPCGACEKRRIWLNRAHSWIRGDT